MVAPTNGKEVMRKTKTEVLCDNCNHKIPCDDYFTPKKTGVQLEGKLTLFQDGQVHTIANLELCSLECFIKELTPIWGLTLGGVKIG